MSKKITITECVAIFISFLALIAFVISSYTNHNLMKQQQAFEKETRKNQICPDIRISSETGYNDGLDKKTLVFENVGNGIAQDLVLKVRANDRILPLAYHSFILVGSEKKKQNYILPSQKLKISVGISDVFVNKKNWTLKEKWDKVLPLNWIYYFSYFDLDGNEYLLVLPELYLGERGLIMFTTEECMFDSLILTMPKNQRILLDSINIRTEGRWFKRK